MTISNRKTNNPGKYAPNLAGVVEPQQLNTAIGGATIREGTVYGPPEQVYTIAIGSVSGHLVVRDGWDFMDVDGAIIVPRFDGGYSVATPPPQGIIIPLPPGLPAF